MKNNKTILKSILFSIFILSGFSIFCMETAKNDEIILKNIINNTNEVITIINYWDTPILHSEVGPKEQTAVNYTIHKSPDGSYGNLGYFQEQGAIQKYSLTGKYKQFNLEINSLPQPIELSESNAE